MTEHNPRSRRLSRSGRWLRGAVGLAILVAASEILGRAGIVDRSYLPPASDILARAVGLAGDPDFQTNLLSTIKAWALGLAIAVAGGVPLGLLIGGVPAVGVALRPILEFLRPIPSVALIPLVGLILGAGIRTESTLIVYASLWPVLYNTIYGLQDVDPVAKETLRTFGFGRLAVMWRVSLPAAAPFIATGIRLAAAVALILAVGTEILSGFGQGIGIFIAQAENGTDSAKDVLAGTVWAGALGLVINALLVQAEQRLFRWHAAQSGGRS
jgi:NitT/TauT family transport system permease protein